MGGVFGNLAYVCSEIWKQIGVAQRLSIGLVGLVGLAAVGGVLYFGTRPNWHVLYSELPQETAAKIYEIAKDAKIPVQLADNGRTVKVPYKYANQVRVAVSQNRLDVEQEGVGLELFDELKLGMTEMQQRVGWQRAMQGELERMIARIEGVRSARVILALPEQRVFRRDESSQAEASVFVELDGNRQLPRAKVQSICRMVAGAVPMLRPDDVTVTDSNGNLLARGLGDGTGSGGMIQYLELCQSMEELLRDKAESVLRPIVGDDAVVAVVNVELDDSLVETTTETFDSASAVVISEKVVSEDNTKLDGKQARAVGSTANLVSVQNPQEGAAATDQSSESRKTVENQYVVPKTVRRVAGRNPRIVRLSVAVTIGQAKPGESRDAAVLAQYKELVASAVGAVVGGADGREDAVTVVEGSFVQPAAPELPEPSPVDQLMQMVERVQFGSLGRSVLAFLLLFVLYRMFGGMLRRNQMDSMDLLAADSGMGPHAALPGGGSGAGGMLQQVMSVPAAKVRAKAEEAPSEVAANLEAWMTQDAKYE
jgi:flagellar M-ring protein FliF